MCVTIVNISMQIRRHVSDVPIPGITNQTTDTSGQEDGTDHVVTGSGMHFSQANNINPVIPI